MSAERDVLRRLVEAAKRVSEQPHGGLLDLEWVELQEAIEAVEAILSQPDEMCDHLDPYGRLYEYCPDYREFCPKCGKDLR